MEALQEAQHLEKIYLKRGMGGETISTIVKLAKAQNVPMQSVPIEKLNRLTRKNHQGIVAELSFIEYQSIENVLSQVYDSGELPLFVVLDQISDVRNFGAIARTALCMGAHALVIPFRGSANINEEALKTSAGALMQIQVCRCVSLPSTVDYLQQNGLALVASDVSGKTFFQDVDLNIPMAVVMGSEGEGVGSVLLEKADIVAKIPMAGKFDSLNVSVATGMILYEVLRQRSVGFG